ncbi:type 1 fimbrial protein [Pseudomonas sp. ADAK18]|uniref:fimbrial protein n=1 Tax=Pseudomonas sp. ADAK18 TaxID=2730848 RepID=UPI001463B7BD|nr:fimbrial protein [Pseudomonas sp. ADAK18]QJI30300.1 type 1 fimbrial protein [Pseudomonas sp. ADAK18]
MSISALIKSGLAVMTLWAAASTAMAVTCTYTNGIQPAVGSMPLQISAITVGRDVPVGTEVYRQRFNIAAGQVPRLECLYAPYQQWSDLTVDTSYGLANVTSGTYANKVYRTSIPGLGVAFNSVGGPLPRQTNKSWTSCSPGFRCLVPLDGPSNFELILIKVGDVSPGVLVGSTLPVVSFFGNFNDARMLGFKMGISGNIQIVSRTCSTPNVSVPMGTHQTNKFTGLNSASGWVDFAIGLNDCPAFHGTYSTAGPGWISQSGNSPSGTGTSGTLNNNSLQYRIDPARLAINANNGVLSIDPSAAGSPAAASGIGVQVATNTGASLALGTNRNSGLTLRASEGSYSIPLKARYLQTASQVTPGPANASATFTIIYQ